jgi:hypothetical protein
MVDATTEATGAQQEIERLRARVAALEQELVEQAERSHRAVAEAQARTYWLDRYNLDLDALMRRRSAGVVRALLRALRTPVRALRRVRKALRDEP